MVFKKGFTLLVVNRTKPFLAIVSIISDNGCSFNFSLNVEAFINETYDKEIQKDPRENI